MSRPDVIFFVFFSRAFALNRLPLSIYLHIPVIYLLSVIYLCHEKRKSTQIFILLLTSYVHFKTVREQVK